MDNRPSLNFRNDPSEGMGQAFGPTQSGEYVWMIDVTRNADGTFKASYQFYPPNAQFYPPNAEPTEEPE
jgi:hypothetical protein